MTTIVSKVFNEDLDEVENFLLNRNVTPIYTSTFQVPTEANDGSYYVNYTNLTWPLYGILEFGYYYNPIRKHML